MNYKQWTAIIQLLGGALVSLWLAYEAMGPGLGDGTPAGLATRLLWAVGALVAFNVVGMILATILVGMAGGGTLKDEPADERDEAVDARSGRVAYMATAIVAAVSLVPLAMGADAGLAVLMLFAAPLAGGLAHAAAQLVYYRIG